jgi:hypothetical protein
MIGGIYIEVPFGDVYDENKQYAVRKNVQKLLGVDKIVVRGTHMTRSVNLLSKKELDYYIIDAIMYVMRVDIGRAFMYSQTHGPNVGYDNITADLMNSTCGAVFKDGKLSSSVYRFTKGQPNTADRDYHRLIEMHPSPEDRANTFMRQYECSSKGFCAVIASTMPYAVRIEKGYGYSVLKASCNEIINRLLAMRSERLSGSPFKYGYVFESAA